MFSSASKGVNTVEVVMYCRVEPFRSIIYFNFDFRNMKRAPMNQVDFELLPNCVSIRREAKGEISV